MDVPEGFYFCTVCRRILPHADLVKSKTIKRGVRALCKRCHVAAVIRQQHARKERKTLEEMPFAAAIEI